MPVSEALPGDFSVQPGLGTAEPGPSTSGRGSVGSERAAVWPVCSRPYPDRAPFFGGTAGPVTASRAPQPAGCGETAQVEGRVCPRVSLSEQLRLWALWVLRVSSDLGIKRKPMK